MCHSHRLYHRKESANISSTHIRAAIGINVDVLLYTAINRSYALRKIIAYLLAHLLNPWSRVPLEKLTVSAASQEIPRIFGTRKFITVLTSARHLFLSWANFIQSPQLPPTSWRSILILSSHLRLGLPKWSLSLRIPHQNSVHTSPFPNTCHMPRPYHSSSFYHPHNIGSGVQLLLM